jgi:hypothetical protein
MVVQPVLLFTDNQLKLLFSLKVQPDCSLIAFQRLRWIYQKNNKKVGVGVY